MAILSKTSVVFMLLLSAIFLLSAPAHARKLEVMRVPIRSMRPPCTPRSVLQETATQTESTTPGHSPSIGHNSPPN
ncbi:LOW QUALITY PROTEIN: hypothetical protein SORBI_3010G259001 [Sorghum bicolor]|uniref:Uncharacterized protein n=1 Tax=Sorghum bicolor TaxID=4558 RepID=A0A1W0VUW9_SORBI|nr:LOW QUALITY PROTEIN: hypothetical protein SORBI_3010G259001 [Sorghum bicolor]